MRVLLFLTFLVSFLSHASDFDKVMEAVEKGVSVRGLKNQGVNLNEKNEVGDAPLHAAIKGWNLKATQDLVNAGVDLNMKDQWGNSPLHLFIRTFVYSAEAEQMAQVEKVLKSIITPQNINVKSPYDHNPLEMLTQTHHIYKDIQFSNHKEIRDGVLMAIKVLAKKVDLNSVDSNSQTALHKVLQAFNISFEYEKEKREEIKEAIKLYITSENINIQDSQGKFPFFIAYKFFWGKDILEPLVPSKKEQRNALLEQIFQSEKDRYQSRILRGDTPGAFALLLDKGVDLNTIDREGKTPLHKVTTLLHFPREYLKNKSEEITAIITRFKTSQNVNVQDSQGKFPLHLVLFSDWRGEGVLKSLMTPKNVSVPDNQGSTPLDIAKDRGNQTAVQLIQNLKNSSRNI